MLRASGFLYFVLVPIVGFAIEYAPWYGTSHEIRPKIEETYQYYHDVKTSKKPKTYNSNDNFLRASLSTTLLAEWDVEVEGTFAFTKRQRRDFDHFCMTLRHILMDDIALDPFSLSAGVSLITAYRHSVHDPSSFHHGKYEGEAHVAIGRETSTGIYWNHRLWAMAAIGCATSQSSPWIKACLQWERNACDQYKYYAFTRFLCGLGRHSLELHDFKGYGSVAHRSVDIGLGWQGRIRECYVGQLQASYRVFAQDFPCKTWRVLASLERPFGL